MVNKEYYKKKSTILESILMCEQNEKRLKTNIFEQKILDEMLEKEFQRLIDNEPNEKKVIVDLFEDMYFRNNHELTMSNLALNSTLTKKVYLLKQLEILERENGVRWKTRIIYEAFTTFNW